MSSAIHPMYRYRRSRGISLDALARAARVDKSTLSRIERGKQLPSLGLVQRLMDATGGALSPQDFLTMQAAAE